MRWSSLVGLAVLLGIGAAGWYWLEVLPGTAPAQQRGEGRRGAQRNAPVPVSVEPVVTQNVPLYRDGIGNVQALSAVTVRAQIDGRLMSVEFVEGQTVRKGDVLARIDPTVYQAQLDQAVAKKAQDEATLANARLDLQRYQRLAQTNAGPKQQADQQAALVAQLEAQVRSDNAAIDNAKAILGYTTIASPIDGRVGLRVIDPGNIVHAGDANGLVSVAQIAPIATVFTLPQRDLATILAAMARGKVQVEILEADGRTVQSRGTLETIDNQIDVSTGTMKLKAVFPNQDRKLWPGQFVSTRVVFDTLVDAKVVPTVAIRRGPSGTFVYVIAADGATAAVRPVKIVVQDDIRAVIESGLEVGERVVTAGFSQLADGKPVVLTGEAKPAEAPAAATKPKGERKREGGAGGGEKRKREGGAAPDQALGKPAPAKESHPVSVSAPFISRPIATSLLAVAVLIVGVLGYRGLPVSSLPQVDFPTISVTTNLPGASPETIVALVTGPLERQLGQIPALTLMTSTSSFGISQITLQFDLGRDIDGAAQDVQSAINGAAATLPRTLPYPPTYAKINPGDTPILTLALTSPTVPLRELSDLADTLIAQRLSESPGVGSVSVQGGLKPAIRIQADLEALASYGLSLEDIRSAVAAANVSSPKGLLDGKTQSYTIAANDQITSAKDYALITIAYRNGAPVLLRDVARVADGFENERIGAWHLGRPAVVIDVRRQPGANIVDTVSQINAELPRLSRALPADAQLVVVSDRTGTIRASIKDVQFTLALSVGLVILVVFLFLRTVSATVIAGTALPLSLIGTFAVMWLAGFSLDNLSLMALTIGTGFVVDDAIVMIENIARHREDGEDRLTAAYRGASEIGFTVISLTASLLAVFIPLLFMSGLVGRMFREFALTLSIAVVVSAIISLTLTPMMCAALLPDGGGHRTEAKRGIVSRLGDGLATFYDRTLAYVLRHRVVTLFVTFATLAATIALYASMPKSFLPQQDTGLIAVVIKAAPDASFAEMVRLQGVAVTEVRKIAEVADVVSVAGSGALNLTPNVATLTVVLRPHEARRRDATTIAREIETALVQIPGVVPFAKPVQDVQIATRNSFSQYQYTLLGSASAEVRRWGGLLLAELEADDNFRNVNSIEEDQGLATNIVIDRVRAGQFGVSLQSVSDILNDAFAQRQISTIFGQANQYRVVLEVDPRFRTDPMMLSALRLPGTVASQTLTTTNTIPTASGANAPLLTPGSNGTQVPLASIATIRRETAPLAISHQEQFPSYTISFDLAEGQSLKEAVKAIALAQTNIGMPDSITGSFAGEAAEFRASLAGQPWLILAAVIAIYIVLGVLYESYVHPLTILSTLPSAGIGALLALLAVGEHLTVIAVIGIILLMGIVKKNAIMMIDFAIEAERGRGLSPDAAIVEACRLRFRPIMMTTLAALFGALPLALASGPGAELRMPLGVSIIGGLLLSQVLTLYTTPVIYLALDDVRRWLLGEPAHGATTNPPPSEVAS